MREPVPFKSMIAEDVRRIVADVLDIADDEDDPEVALAARLYGPEIDPDKDNHPLARTVALAGRSLGCSELDVIEIAVDVELHFDISFAIERIEEWRTVRDIVRSTEKALGY